MISAMIDLLASVYSNREVLQQHQVGVFLGVESVKDLLSVG
jgi:hypothetical protein